MSGAIETGPAGPRQRPVRGLRYVIVTLLCVSTELNYLDRQTLSVLAQTIKDDLQITTVQYAHVTGAFLLTYTIMYGISGRIVDALGSRLSLTLFSFGWSVATVLHFLAGSPAQLAGCRALLGVFEPGNFPAGIRAIAEWFPIRERALAVGIFNGGTGIGAALAAPLVSWIALQWGWRSAFVVTGAIGLVWSLAWWLFYRPPRKHGNLSNDELRLIEDGSAPRATVAPVPFRQLLAHRRAWVCIAVRALTDPMTYLFLFWVPLYLQQEIGLSLAAIGKYSWIPYLALAFGNVAGGVTARLLIKRGWTLDRARKLTMAVASCLVAAATLAITHTHDLVSAITVISFSMFCQAAWGNTVLPVEILPNRWVGSVTGLAGMVGGTMGILSQQAIGWIVERHSFAPVFLAAAPLYLVAFLTVSLFAGKLGVIDEPRLAAAN